MSETKEKWLSWPTNVLARKVTCRCKGVDEGFEIDLRKCYPGVDFEKVDACSILSMANGVAQKLADTTTKAVGPDKLNVVKENYRRVYVERTWLAKRVDTREEISREAFEALVLKTIQDEGVKKPSNNLLAIVRKGLLEQYKVIA